MAQTLLDIFTVLQSVPSSGSGRGISYWKAAAECGRKVRLLEQHKMQVQAEEADEAEAANKPIGRIVGTYGHVLQQAYHEGRLPENLVIDADAADVHFREAVRCMRVYRRFWPADYFGEVVGCEIKFPRAEDEASLLRDVFGDDFTFRADLMVRMSEERAAEIELSRGVSLNGAGLYIVDHKFLWQIDKTAVWDYAYGPQSLAYPIAYNLLHANFPDRYPVPVQGMIFDCMSRQTQKEENFKESHFQLIVSQALPEDVDVIRNTVRVGQAMLSMNLPNPNACVGKYGPCPFLKNGQCDRRS